MTFIVIVIVTVKILLFFVTSDLAFYGSKWDSNPNAQFLLDIGDTHIIVVMRGEHKLSKELGESKRIPIPVLNFFLTLE